MEDDKTRPYSDRNDTDRTQAYQSDPDKTQTYGEAQPDDKTIGYDTEQIPLTDKTIAHDLGVGDEIKLNDEKYTITEIISGESRTLEAVIYKIKNTKGKVFALKLYYKFTNPKDEPNREALARIKATHDPDILKLYDFGTGSNKYQNRFCFEICDFAEGLNLISVPDLREKYTTEFIRSNVIPEIFKGIRTLHDNKIYHCDLKPENIFYLDKEQTDLIIGDYGSAKTFEETSEKKLTHTSTTKGTSFYLAPEQTRGIVSEKNDYYSFGIVLLHLLYPEYVNHESLKKIIERQFSRKPVIDFDPSHGRVNDLIAGLTLSDINSRWGEDEVKAWLRNEDVEVQYISKAEVLVQPINLGKTVIRTEQELISYLENNKDWNEDLIEDKEGYSLFLRWLSDLQGLDKKKVFDKMVRTYQQDGKDFVEQAVLRYFFPERPIRVDMKTYDFWGTKDLSILAEEFVNHLDDIWKITPLESMKFYLFQLEFTLRQIEIGIDDKLKVLVKSIIEKVASGLSASPKFGFDDYICTLYVDLNDKKLLDLFYTFDRERTFKNLKNKSYKTIEDIGLFFAENEKIFDNRYINLEKELFLDINNLIKLKALNYADLLFEIFKDHVKTKIDILEIKEEKNSKSVIIKYNIGFSLLEYLSRFNITNRLYRSHSEDFLDIKNKLFRPTKTHISYFLSELENKYKILNTSITEDSINVIKNKFRYFFYKNKFKNLFKFSTIISILVVFVYLPFWGYRYLESQKIKESLSKTIDNKGKSFEVKTQNQAYAIITSEVANIRSEPSTKSKIIDSGEKGDKIKIIKKTNKWYLINHNGKEGYINSSIITLLEVIAPVTWRQKGGEYWIYVDGELQPTTKSSWIDNDALVYIPKLKRYCILKDYKKKKDNTLREAVVLPINSSVAWRIKGGNYWVYVDGELQHDLKSSWMDNDAMVYIPKLKRFYVLKDYKKKNDNTLREAIAADKRELNRQNTKLPNDANQSLFRMDSSRYQWKKIK